MPVKGRVDAMILLSHMYYNIIIVRICRLSSNFFELKLLCQIANPLILAITGIKLHLNAEKEVNVEQLLTLSHMRLITRHSNSFLIAIHIEIKKRQETGKIT